MKEIKFNGIGRPLLIAVDWRYVPNWKKALSHYCRSYKKEHSKASCIVLKDDGGAGAVVGLLEDTPKKQALVAAPILRVYSIQGVGNRYWCW